MVRSSFKRVFAAWLAVWFTINVVAPGRLYACPVHDAQAASPAASHGAHAGHGSPAAQHGSGKHHDDATHLCHCIGSCCTAAPLASPATPSVASTERRIDDVALPSYEGAPIPRRAHELPFANGPPIRVA